MKFTLPPRIEKRLEPAVLALIRRHVATRYRLLDGLAALTRRPAKDLEVAKERIARAAQKVAVDCLDGRIARRDIAGQIDARAGRDQGAEQERTFAEFSRHTLLANTSQSSSCQSG